MASNAAKQKIWITNTWRPEGCAKNGVAPQIRRITYGGSKFGVTKRRPHFCPNLSKSGPKPLQSRYKVIECIFGPDRFRRVRMGRGRFCPMLRLTPVLRTCCATPGFPKQVGSRLARGGYYSIFFSPPKNKSSRQSFVQIAFWSIFWTPGGSSGVKTVLFAKKISEKKVCNGWSV